MSNDPRSSVAGAPEPDLSDTPRESRRASTGQGTVRSKGAPLWSWPQRLVRASALLLFVMSGIVWMRPVNIPGRNLQPFGCGSAANPMTGPLAEIHCMDAIGSSRALALCLLIGAGLLLGIGESLVARFPSYSARMALAASTGVPLAAFGISIGAVLWGLGRLPPEVAARAVGLTGSLVIVTLVLVFLTMAVVLAVRPQGLAGQPLEAGPREIVQKFSVPSAGRPSGAIFFLVFFALCALAWSGGDYSRSLASDALVLLIFGVSLQSMMALGGLVSFGHAAFFGLGAYGAALSHMQWGASLPVALAAGCALAGAAAGWGCGVGRGASGGMAMACEGKAGRFAMLGNVPAARKPINPANTTAVFPISQQSRCWLRVRILQRPQNLVLWALIHPLSGFQEGRWTKYRPCAYSPVSLKPAHSRAPPIRS